MKLIEVIERIFAVIGALNFLIIVLAIVFLAPIHQVGPKPKRITKEKFDRVTRGRKIW